MLQLPVYMDNHATTRTDPRVLEAMLPYFCDQYGNPASRHHAFGWKAEEAVENARLQIARLIGAEAKEIIFTSGATESNNLALKGAAAMYRQKGDHIITVATEHHAVLDPCKRLQSEGFQVSVLPVDRDGLVDPQCIADSINKQTILVSVMAANNEIGVVQPIAEIGRICKEHHVLFHCDAVQAVGKIPIDVEIAGIDLLSMTAHKMYGPKGVGALYVRRRNPNVRLQPLFDGGGHERGLRSGTLAVPNIVGFGKACELCQTEMEEEGARIRQLRDRLHQGLSERLDHIQLNGHPTKRLPGNLNVSFGFVNGEALLTSLNDLAVSSGSACTSANVEPSYVLRALGIADELARSSIRFGLGRFNTQEEVDFAIEYVGAAVDRLRAISPAYEMARK
ncbi:MAG: cysteine desulfurase IscS [Gemmatales bacterium]|nr:MAG: cysteine desulfurase IscS [Gemmatales bacterium]